MHVKHTSSVCVQMTIFEEFQFPTLSGTSLENFEGSSFIQNIMWMAFPGFVQYVTFVCI
jgi:hypothetical protein